MRKEVAIAFDNLSFSYNKELILESVNFNIKAGARVGIIGPNGGGKTTALKLMMGLLSPTRGSVTVFNEPPKASRHCIGYVPQRLAYDTKFPISVEEVVLLGTLNRFGKPCRCSAKKALEQLGLTALAKSPFSDLSGGQAQKTLIARALASKPKILLLDEATANIDPPTQKNIFTFLSTLDDQITICMVSHSLSTIQRHFSQILCFQKTVAALDTKDICNHFTVGLYHQPPSPGNSYDLS